ncbi:MAG: rod shape-determining protein MreD [candidate division WOR-3 bacterium]|nr:MAG: rod shape-determining protein MreD [candidate division WOR-3 bacterium]
MRYFIYFVLLYILLPFNVTIDVTIILLFFIIFNENERFALIFAFISGFLIDLYNPGRLGVNMLVYTLLCQSLLYLKKYILRSLLTTFLTFIIFYLTKNIVVHIILGSPLSSAPIALTIITFFPIFWLLHRLVYGVWMKT